MSRPLVGKGASPKVAIKALRELIDTKVEPQHVEAYFQEISGAKSDRGMGILMVTGVEDALAAAIEARLSIATGRPTDDARQPASQRDVVVSRCNHADFCPGVRRCQRGARHSSLLWNASRTPWWCVVARRTVDIRARGRHRQKDRDRWKLRACADRRRRFQKHHRVHGVAPHKHLWGQQRHSRATAALKVRFIPIGPL
jgi:hypothetical protein